MLQITCHTFDKLPLDAITDFQGDLKKRTSEDTEKIIASLHKNGFAFPFFIWKKGDINYCLDGHGRMGALKKMRADGEEIPELPIVYVDAENEREAKIKLLQVNSQYGRIDVDVLHDFAVDIDLDQFSLPELGKAAFIFEKQETEKRETVQLFKSGLLQSCVWHCKNQCQTLIKLTKKSLLARIKSSQRNFAVFQKMP